MWFWLINEMIELFLYIYIYLIFPTRNMSSLTPGGTRTPGWIPFV